MTDDRSLERAARSWLEEGPDRAPEAAVDAALSRIQTSRQERDWVPRRISTMSTFTRLLAAATLGVAVVAGAIVIGPRLQGPNVAAPSNPIASSTPGPSTSATDAALAAYRTARNAICNTGGFEIRQADLSGVYDANQSADRRAIVNAGAQQVADAAAKVARDLATLTPPPGMAEAHAADVAHAQALAAIFATGANLLKEGNIQGAQAMEHALDAIHDLRKPFEDGISGLVACP